MKHIKLLKTEAEFEAMKDSLVEPWVVHTKDELKVHYKPAYKFVDLGLSVKWATVNVGAEKPEDIGLYFQWGDVVGCTKEQILGGAKTFDYNAVPYQTNGSAGIMNGQTKFTKYLASTDSQYKDPSATDEDALKVVLDLEDDAAYVKSHGAMRMPTGPEIQELVYGTSLEYTTENGVVGIKFISNSDSSKYIFVPCSGSAFQNGILAEDFVYLWSSQLYSQKPYGAWMANVSAQGGGIGNYYRYYGHNIRGVQV